MWCRAFVLGGTPYASIADSRTTKLSATGGKTSDSWDWI